MEGAPVEEAVADDHKPRAKRSPVLPSAEVMARHCLTHIPFRSWCDLCVPASAPHNPHRRSEDEPAIDEVQLEYMMLGSVVTAEEYEEAERGEFMIWISKADTKLPADVIMPQLIDPQWEAPQVLEIMMTVLNMAHRQSDAVHPILGPKGDHPYMTEGACAVLESWGIGECILKAD